MPDVDPVERGFLLLQAAVVEGALSDVETAYGRLDQVLDCADDDLLTLVKVCADFVTRWTFKQGSEWTTTFGGDGNQINIEDRSPSQRVFSRRALAAWSADDHATVEALFRAACADPVRRHDYIRDLFELTIDRCEELAGQAGNPRTIVWQFCHSINRIRGAERE